MMYATKDRRQHWPGPAFPIALLAVAAVLGPVCSFAGPPEEAVTGGRAVSGAEALSPKRISLSVSEQWMPVSTKDPATPQTRTLTPAEAGADLEQDWFFQAMGEPLLQRTGKELVWARELADRLSLTLQPPDLSTEREELDRLETRLSALEPDQTMLSTPADTATVPSWIWYPEGEPAQDAPAQARFFRCAFDIPDTSCVQLADLRVAADDTCEVYLNGTRLGTHSSWQSTAAYRVGKALQVGKNVIAIRAENKPAPHKNPAGLLARLTIILADGTRRTVISSSAWQAANHEQDGWTKKDFDDHSWPSATVAAPFGGGPWGRIRGLNESGRYDEATLWYAHETAVVKELYLAVRQVKRRIMFKNPRLDFERIVFIDQPYPGGGAWTHESIHRMGHRAIPGGRLLLLEGLHPGGKVPATVAE